MPHAACENSSVRRPAAIGALRLFSAIRLYTMVPALPDLHVFIIQQ